MLHGAPKWSIGPDLVGQTVTPRNRAGTAEDSVLAGSPEQGVDDDGHESPTPLRDMALRILEVPGESAVDPAGRADDAPSVARHLVRRSLPVEDSGDGPSGAGRNVFTGLKCRGVDDHPIGGL